MLPITAILMALVAVLATRLKPAGMAVALVAMLALAALDLHVATPARPLTLALAGTDTDRTWE